MNLARLILIAAVLWLAIYLLRRIVKQLNPPKKPEDETPKKMVRCARCGLHLPEAEAILDRGKYFCCEEHRRNPSSTP